MLMELVNVSHIYNQGTPFMSHALKEINLSVDKGEFIGIIGHTGSGKSTLVQHLNGLMLPTSGKVIIDGIDTSTKGISLANIRQKVGLVFQYPEHQLFEETVYKDIAFGPVNLGLNEEGTKERVVEAMEQVRLDYKELKDRSPFELSGGQKRRVAIAGVLAMKPDVLVLDEPTAGLDPVGRDEILSEITSIYKKTGITIILVSHSMEDIARVVNRILVMDKGRLVMDDKPRQIFNRVEELEKMGLGIPEITRFMRAYKESGHDVRTDVITVDDAVEVLLEELRKRHA
ncbi:MAG: energy-coupling factor transporter ATPase [Tissierellia bacterium]|nr:energy-coupling factor transporter ATPase [Tissierellia bacterium]